MWLEFIGVVSGWLCKEPYRFPQILLILTPHAIALFSSSSIPTALFIFKMFFSFFKKNKKTKGKCKLQSFYFARGVLKKIALL